MEDAQLKELLKSYDHFLKEARVLNLQSWVINYACFENIQMQKAKKKLGRLSRIKLLAVAAGVVWVVFLALVLLQAIRHGQVFLMISAGAIILFNVLAIVVYIHQMVLLARISNSEDVLETQKKITQLRLSTLQITRILFLQSPFYCIFWWTVPMITGSPLSFWLVSFPIALLFTWGSLWLFKNISVKNIHKKWFRILFGTTEWTSLVKAREYLDEIQKFRKN